MTCEPETGAEDARQTDNRIPVPLLSQDVVARIAHELRSPLSVMSNVLRVCRTSIAPTAMPAAGDVLARQVNKALRLVNDLMDLTRLSERQLPLERVPVDLGRVVLNAAQDLEQEVRARGQMVDLRLPGGALWVRGDATRLEQIVGNLLENSSKYSGEGGRIVLALSQEDGQAVLSVRDDGDGISSADLPRVFDPYFRGSDPAKTARGGLGLGLTLTRRLVQLHGGTIEAKSRGVGCGSEFIVRLPLDR